VTQCSETTGDGPRGESSHGDVQVEVNSQIADATNRLEYVEADSKWYIWELTLTTSGRTPENFSFNGIQLQTVRPHPCSYVVDALSYFFLESCSSIR